MKGARYFIQQADGCRFITFNLHKVLEEQLSEYSIIVNLTTLETYDWEDEEWYKLGEIN